MSWKAWESVFWSVLGLAVSTAVVPIAAFAALILASWAGTASHTDLAQATSLGSGPLLPLLPHPDSATTSTAPPESAAASFLFTGLVPSMALGPRTLHGGSTSAPCRAPPKALFVTLDTNRDK